MKQFSKLSLVPLLLPVCSLSAWSKVHTSTAAEMYSNRIEVVQQKTVTIKGVVKDAQGEPIVGVQVIPVGASNKSALTAAGGKYSLSVPANVKEVIFYYLGFQKQKVKLNGRSEIDVVMRENSQVLNEVVVTALGIKRSQKALSYNVQELKGDALQTNKDANFVNSLNGKVAGVTINQSSSGPGSAAKVVMRGAKSIQGSNNALYVIDGVPIFSHASSEHEGGKFASMGATESAADINPDDIESISVLTGASAAALYGSAAANGAIVITTKKGKAGSLKVNYGFSAKFGNPMRLPDFQNRYGSDAGIMSWGHKLDGSAHPYEVKDFFRTSRMLTHNVSLSGGTEKNQTYVSFAATNSNGLVVNNKYDRYNVNARNTTSLLDDRLTLDLGAEYVNQYHRNMVNQGEYMNPMVAAYLMPRSESNNSVKAFETFDVDRNIYIQNWKYGQGNYTLQNPYWQAYRNLREMKRERYVLSAAAKYELMRWSPSDVWNIAGRLRYDNTRLTGTDRRFASTLAILANPNGFYGENNGWDKQTYADLITTFNKGFQIGEQRLNVNAVLGTSLQDSRYEMRFIEGNLNMKGIPNVFNIFNIDQADPKTFIRPEGWHEQTQSIFGSVELGLNSYLFLTLTGRNDWASQLAKSPNSSFFYPSVGLSGVVTQMLSPELRERIRPILSYLKVRASYASVASPFQRGLTTPVYMPDKDSKSYRTQTYFPIGKLYPERTDSYEAGISARMFKNHVSLDASYYRTVTKNQTLFITVPAASGYEGMYVQSGKVRNQGVETSLGLHFGNEDGVHYNSTFTFSYNQNKIINLAENYENPMTGKISSLKELEVNAIGSLRYILRKGGTLGDIYTTQDFKRDVNGDIFVGEDGNLVKEEFLKGEKHKIGSVLPKCNYGWSNEIGYKGLSIGALITARQGGVVVSATEAAMDHYGVSEQSAAARDLGYVQLGTQRLEPEKYFITRGKENGMLQYYTYSATNVRVAEAHISYKFPAKWFANKANLTLSLTGHNLGFIYCKAPFDPEAISATGNYSQGLDYFMMPSQRTYGFSIKVGF